MRTKNKRYRSLTNWLMSAKQSGATIDENSIVKSANYIVYSAKKDGKEIGWFDNFDNVGYLPTATL